MALLIVLIFGVASGVFTSGSRDGESNSGGAPAPIETSPTVLPSTLDPTSTDGDGGAGAPPEVPALRDLVGTWTGDDGTTLQVGPDAGFRLSQPGAGTTRGVVRTGVHLFLLVAFDVPNYGLVAMRSTDSIDVAIDEQDVIHLERVE